MEIGGVVIAGLSLASLFKDAIECFAYIEAGRNFSISFQTSKVKLSNAEPRLSRWGKAVGLEDGVDDVSVMGQMGLGDDDCKEAKERLRHIARLIASAEQTSKKYGDTAQNTGEDTDGPPATKFDAISNGFRRMSLSRRKSTSLKHRTTWALIDEQQLNKLLADITGLVRDLEDLFPAAAGTRQQLANQEAQKLTSNVDIADLLSMLKDMATEHQAGDRLLEEALKRVQDGTEPASPGTMTSHFGQNNTGFQAVQFNGGGSTLTFGARNRES